MMDDVNLVSKHFTSAEVTCTYLCSSAEGRAAHGGGHG